MVSSAGLAAGCAAADGNRSWFATGAFTSGGFTAGWFTGGLAVGSPAADSLTARKAAGGGHGVRCGE